MQNPEKARAKRAEWQELILQQEKSGLSVRVFCQQHGVGEHCFYYWRRRLANSQPVRFALVETSAVGRQPPAPVELHLASGERLQIAAGVDAATLRTVLAVLRERA